MAASLSVPGDPDALDAAATAMESVGQATGLIASSTGQLTTTVLQGWKQGEGAASFDAYGTNLAAGMGQLPDLFGKVVSGVRGFSGSLRNAQLAAAGYNAAAAAAQNDSSGVAVSQAEQAWLKASDAISSMNQQGGQAAALILSAADGLDDLFGNGPVQQFLGGGDYPELEPDTTENRSVEVIMEIIQQLIDIIQGSGGDLGVLLPPLGRGGSSGDDDDDDEDPPASGEGPDEPEDGEPPSDDDPPWEEFAPSKLDNPPLTPTTGGVGSIFTALNGG